MVHDAGLTAFCFRESPVFERARDLLDSVPSKYLVSTLGLHFSAESKELKKMWDELGGRDAAGFVAAVQMDRRRQVKCPCSNSDALGKTLCEPVKDRCKHNRTDPRGFVIWWSCAGHLNTSRLNGRLWHLREKCSVCGEGFGVGQTTQKCTTKDCSCRVHLRCVAQLRGFAG
jgi:hypothetical protein